MGPDVEAIVAEHNAEALDKLLDYVTGYVTANTDSLTPGNMLPMSGLQYPLHNSEVAKQNGPIQQAVIAGALLEFRKKVLIASPFVALSGTPTSSEHDLIGSADTHGC